MPNNTPVPPRRPINKQAPQQRQRAANVSAEQYAQQLRIDAAKRRKAQEKRRRMYIRRRIVFGLFCVCLLVMFFFLIKFIIEKVSDNKINVSSSTSISQNSTSQPETVKSEPESTTSTANTTSQEPESVPASAVQETGFALNKLANANNPIPTGYVPEVVKVDQAGHEVDTRAADAIKKLIKDGNATGLELMICSAYRSNERQTKLFNDMKADYVTKGMTQEEAYNKTKTIRSIPGTSEHETGLAIDIVSVKNQVLDDNFEKTPEFKWLSENAVDYGFILRYPREKGAITGIIYEPWHYRYVGVEVAKEIKEKGLCLEEYAALQVS